MKHTRCAKTTFEAKELTNFQDIQKLLVLLYESLLYWSVSGLLIVTNVCRLLQQSQPVVSQCPPVSETGPSLNISSSRSCPGPPVPWLPAVTTAVPTASHQLPQLPANSCHIPTSYSVTNRLNNVSNQLSVDSGASYRHPPQYSESQVS